MDLEAQTIRQMSSVWSWEAVERSIQGHLRNFRVFGDSALDCESKLMLARAGKRVHITCIYQGKPKVILIVVN